MIQIVEEPQQSTSDLDINPEQVIKVVSPTFQVGAKLSKGEVHKVPGDCEDDNLSDGLGDESEFNQSLYWMQRLNVIGDEVEML